jgi:hypothetical protein
LQVNCESHPTLPYLFYQTSEYYHPFSFDQPINRVIEYLGPAHRRDACEADCASDHAFFFVRVPVSKKQGSQAATQGPQRRLDLVLDLHTGLRHSGKLEGMLALDHNRLEDAWALLEPESIGEAAAAAEDASALQQPGKRLRRG